MTRLIPKRPLLGVNISVTTYDEVVESVLDHASRAQAFRVTALDAHGLSRAAKDLGFRGIVNAFDVVSPDGHSLRWGLNLLHGAGLKDRVAGPDLTVRLCRAAGERGCPVFLYGSRDYVVRQLQARLKEMVPKLQIAGFRPSRFRASTPEEDQNDIDEICRSRARLVFVGLGCPLQEQWILEHSHRLNMPLLAVGAAFDFISGNKPRAPQWMQDCGVEWAFRILSEPRRLVRRSLPAVTYVFFALLCQRLRFSTVRSKDQHPSAPTSPTQDGEPIRR